MSLVIIGTVAYDAIETPFGKTDKIVGGAATFAGMAASYLYDHVKLISVIGEDFGDTNLNLLKDKGIDTEGIQIIKGGKSFFWSGKYHNDMNSRDTLATELNVLADFDPIVPEKYQDCEYLLLGNLTPQVQLTTLERLNHTPKLVVLDTMNFWMDVALDDLKAVLKKVDVLTINDEEARQLSGEYALVKAAEVILNMGPKYLIIKKGEHGALLFGENQVFYAPALPLAEVFDPTGAGDTFAGGFVGYLAKVNTVNFNNMKNAIIYGSALASFCVERFGTERLQNLTQEDISKRIQQFIALSKFEISE
ncbi:PfkB family carbohydrate kinase [Sphingobacterium spiritivorum]|uniref:Kinase, PfkB family n=2 Tax=Sphingobacterium spiritivorum TaxID=258 RepID=D7VKR7_SPHSI|nr:PfkB family carbohydrate kinase [Sphingobacterium spiritivorum]EEI89562.1 kinase, PfkB family [Sphingobacterium spiritivorum ATCC 33300]EFK58869.1 kinase, PfkB family [Sphingobacterium spiritivorum ATCC 33861]QQS94556.1 bifunctional hydroxymethylpyrimidine kinase/phosphomethylpyrimidine kinase [Sphingobacterium spiritivorum]QQT34253.1 bifunctional hydroxymethylpyrimidine kinase/phosphomethylpyrimidine kinase [Sphingobacterium spiritivorum]WQD35094.1 PfkB family carbohydrate kinase [Sphingob